MNAGDDELRRHLSAAARQVTVQPVTPAALRPRLRRARRVRRATAGAVIVVLVGGGTAAGLQLAEQVRTREVRTISTADRPDDSATSTPDTSDDATTSTAVASTASTTTVPSTSTSDVPTEPPTTIEVGTTVATPGVAPAVAPTTAPSPSVTTIAPPPPPSTTAEPPTTTVAPAAGTTRIESACGAVVVEVTGNATRLTGTEPLAGFAVDVKNDGPEEVEVGFADGRDECEVKAWVTQGVLQTFVDNHGQP